MPVGVACQGRTAQYDVTRKQGMSHIRLGILVSVVRAQAVEIVLQTRDHRQLLKNSHYTHHARTHHIVRGRRSGNSPLPGWLTLRSLTIS
jgi:hypothetical protein